MSNPPAPGQRVPVPDPWPAPRTRGPLAADISLPGSKSITNRAFVLAALATGETEIVRPLIARDTNKMVAGLRELGFDVRPHADDPDRWLVSGDHRADGSDTTAPVTIDTGLAGTVMRFLPSVAALSHRPVTFTGDAEAEARPQDMLIDGLRQLGVTVDDGGRGRLPFTITGGAGLTGRDVSIDASASSQFVSGLLLAAPAYPKGLVLRHTGDSLPSAPHIAMTVDMLRAAGAEVDDSVPNIWEVAPRTLRIDRFEVEPDLSNAAPFLAAAMIAGGSVHIVGWPAVSTQPGMALPDLFTRMGGQVTTGPDGLTVTGTGAVHGLTADLGAVGELTPTIAALCALADGPSTLSGISHLRGHETDRLAALTTELNRLGSDVTETADGLRINPRPLHGGLFHSYADHRMATAGALLGLAVDGVEVENIATTAKTLPDFPTLWSRLMVKS